MLRFCVLSKKLVNIDFAILSSFAPCFRKFQLVVFSLASNV